MKTNIYLVGMMGSGKSTIGKRLACELGYSFADSDREIENLCEVNISAIFDIEGEAGFRKRERAMIVELCKRNGIVVATGGGAVLDPSNRALLRDTGYVIYLETPLNIVLERVTRNRKRPLLSGNEYDEDPRRKLEGMINERDPLYRELASLTVQSSERSAAMLTRRIVEQLPAELTGA